MSNCLQNPISVLVPIGRPDRYLASALRSVAEQTVPMYELVVVSQSKYHDEIEALIKSFGINQFQLIADSGVGLAAALTSAVMQCRYDLIARMDADDIAHPDRLARQHAVMVANPSLAVCGTGVRIIDEYDSVLAVHNSNGGLHEVKSSELLFRNPLVHPSIMMRRSLLEPTGFYSKALIAEDYDLWLRCAGLGLVLARLEEPLLNYRIHSGQLSHAASGLNRARQIARTIRESLRNRHPLGVWLATFVWFARGVYVELKKRLLAGCRS